MGKRAKPQKRSIRLIVIPEPEPGTRSVIEMQGKGTVIMNAGDAPGTTMVCGNCGAPLVKGIRINQLQQIVLRCNGCGSYNETLVS